MKKNSNSNLKVIPLFFETYLALVKNSAGAKTFRNSYAEVGPPATPVSGLARRAGGKKKDILENGGLSCAFFVSSILIICGLIKDIHATVGGTQKDMEKSGWIKIRKPKIGSVIVWEAVEFSKQSGAHKHIGFYVGKNKAISNHHKKGFPVVHHWTFGEKNGKEGRRVEAVYWNKKLG